MSTVEADLMIVGAGPVGMLCAYLANLWGLKALVVDPTQGPLEVGRADALNARTLQLLELAGLFDDLYPLGKACNTSSVWANGRFVSRQSTWWDEIEGCSHKHFLMLGQAHLERLLDHKLKQAGREVQRKTKAIDIRVNHEGCSTRLSSGETVLSKYVVGADGSRSFVRKHFDVKFEITRPEIVWAVMDGVVRTDFPKVPEIVVFQTETSDVAWIPREGDLDRFYVRMDRREFSREEVIARINRAIFPHALSFQEVQWYSQFSVKESVAERFQVHERVFLVGDACHIHSVNGGQGLNTGLGDAFNLIWKLGCVLRTGAPRSMLRTYEAERKPVALGVIETSGELVRSTKFSERGTHATDYVKIVEKRSGYITGMGIRYGRDGVVGSRLFDCEVSKKGANGRHKTRLYSLLNYREFTLLYFGDRDLDLKVPAGIRVVQIRSTEPEAGYWSAASFYRDQLVLVRPDSYIEASVSCS